MSWCKANVQIHIRVLRTMEEYYHYIYLSFFMMFNHITKFIQPPSCHKKFSSRYKYHCTRSLLIINVLSHLSKRRGRITKVVINSEVDSTPFLKCCNMTFIYISKECTYTTDVTYCLVMNKMFIIKKQKKSYR